MKNLLKNKIVKYQLQGKTVQTSQLTDSNVTSGGGKEKERGSQRVVVKCKISKFDSFNFGKKLIFK